MYDESQYQKYCTHREVENCTEKNKCVREYYVGSVEYESLSNSGATTDEYESSGRNDEERRSCEYYRVSLCTKHSGGISYKREKERERATVRERRVADPAKQHYTHKNGFKKKPIVIRIEGGEDEREKR